MLNTRNMNKTMLETPYFKEHEQRILRIRIIENIESRVTPTDLDIIIILFLLMKLKKTLV